MTKTQDNSSTTSAPVTSRVSPWLVKILYPLGNRLVLPLFFGKITVTGRENIPSHEPIVVAPTHRSRWDAIIVPHAVGRVVSGRDPRFMVTVDEIKGLQGWFIRRMGGYAIDTEHPGTDSFRHTMELLWENKMVVIFPEGNIFRGDRVRPLKRGLARIALDVEAEKSGSNVKILPVSIKYSQLIPSWGTDVRVDIGSPLSVADYLSDSLRQSSKKLTADLETALKKMHENNAIPSVTSVIE